MTEQNDNQKEQQINYPLNISNCIRTINYCGDKVIWDISNPQSQSYQNYYYLNNKEVKKQEK